MKLEEHCACGAKFSVDTPTTLDAVDVMQGWRGGHKCVVRNAGNGSAMSFGYSNRDFRRINPK